MAIQNTGFHPNSNSLTLGRYNGKIKRPTWDPIDMSGVNTLQKRVAEADRLAQDPLSAPGAQQQLATISEGLNRQFAAEKGNVVGRAAQSGQAGFGGTFAQTSANLSGQLANTRAQTQSDMMMQIYNKARQEGMDATSALTQAQAEVSRITTERSRVEAEISTQEAEMQQREQDAYRANLLEQARLAETKRQYDEDARTHLSDTNYNRSMGAEDLGFRKRQEARDVEDRQFSRQQKVRQARDEQQRNQQDADQRANSIDPYHTRGGQQDSYDPLAEYKRYRPIGFGFGRLKRYQGGE
jgi:hypothetical protein